MALVRLRGVTKTYSTPRGVDVTALDGVDLDVERGEFVAIVGPSGGGKTTLMNILGILDDPSSGEYVLDGVPVDARDGRHAAGLRAHNVGFVFQAFHLLDARAALDSVELGLLYRATPRHERLQRAGRALSTVDLGDRAGQNAALLSGGQRQRVAIARAVAGDAPLILADEPTGNLDTENGAQVMDILGQLNAEGATIVMVTHSPSHADIAKRTVHMLDGRILSSARRVA